ncbi:hypothetical protein ANCDUO_26601 [Ancylostoma duodenale]|uniref:Uncharacterized protein n=1 Tax=Ancylostoma duodenale TaxID=51022 RepID=A0A0C2BI22_9BILA|nr:hypothetical protein ANCDUO_26601 [Ancylostoma duodenale]
MFLDVPNLPAPDIDAVVADDVVKFCQREDVSLIVVGPEGPLADGFVDQIGGRVLFLAQQKKERCWRYCKISHFWNVQEASKIFSKTFMRDFGLSTARFAQFDDIRNAKAFIEK